ncbi:MAG: flagellar protein FliS [Betaproteobacteria bacterium]|nr:flagellar protein FliS [Betaproteobacteria bacterium]
MRAARAYQNVNQQTSVIAADTLQLVVLLYEKLLDRLREARTAQLTNDIAARGRATSLAIELVEKGLVGSLDSDRGGEIAAQLKEQYSLWMIMIVRFNQHGKLDQIDALEEQVKTVLSAWREIKAGGVRPAA